MRTEQEIRDRIERLSKERGKAEWADDGRSASDLFIAETFLLWALGEPS